jgi:hypothetical protein
MGRKKPFMRCVISVAPAGAFCFANHKPTARAVGYFRAQLRSFRRSKSPSQPFRSGADGRGSSGSRRRHWCRQIEIATSASGVRPSSDAATNETRRFVVKSEAFAQRAEPVPDVSKIFKRAAGLTLLRPGTGALRSITEPAVHGGAGVGEKKWQRRRFNVAVAKHHINFANHEASKEKSVYSFKFH